MKSTHKSSFASITSAVFCILVSATSVLGQSELRKEAKSIKIFDSEIPVKVYSKNSTANGGSIPITFVSLHHNEQVGLQEAKKAVEARGGKLVELVSVSPTNAAPERLILFRKGDKSFAFDPNRIFSNPGIKSTLERWTPGFRDSLPSVQQPIVDAVASFREKLLDLFLPRKGCPGSTAEKRQLCQGEVLVAVHNNLDEGGLTSVDFFEYGFTLEDLKGMTGNAAATRIYAQADQLKKTNILSESDLTALLKKKGIEHKNTKAAYVVTGEDGDDFLIVSTDVLFAGWCKTVLHRGAESYS